MAILFMAISFPFFTESKPTPHPVALQGEFDARQWDFLNRGTLNLSGDWGFQWQVLADPEQTTPLPFTQSLPSIWNEHRYNDQALPGTGYASYQLLLRIPGNAPPLSLLIPDFYGAGTLWLNGTVAAEIGRVGTRKEEEITIDAYRIVPLPENSEVIHLMFHTSSFHHRFGGLYKPLVIGAHQDIERINHIRIITSAAVVGGTLLIAVFLLGVYLGRLSEPLYLIASLTLLFMAMRTFGVDKLWMHLDAMASADWLLKCEYIGWIGSATGFFLYIVALFPNQHPNKYLVTVLSLITLASILYILLTPSEQYVYLRDPWQLLTLLMLITEIVIIARAEIQQESGALIAGMVIMLIAIPVIHDILLYSEFYPSHYWNSLGHYSLFAIGPSIITMLVFRINATSRSEQRLYRELKTLNRELQSRVETRTQQLAHKVDELNVLHQEAEKARQIAEDAKQKRAAFLGLMAHEIRTPLSGIKGSLDLLLPISPTPKARLLLQNANQSTTSLLRLVNDALDLANIDSGRFELKSAPFSLLAWLNNLYETMSLPIKNKGLGFYFLIVKAVDSETDMKALHLDSDGDRLRQVLINLLHNACKFTQQGHIIFTLKLTSIPDPDQPLLQLNFSVEDTGIGIPASELNAIFDRYHQVDDSDSRLHQGSGLGLSISNQIVNTLGGQIQVDSTPKQGSTFSFSITVPCHKVPCHLPQTTQPAETDGLQPKPLAGKALNLLIVEDDKSNRDILYLLLESLGHRVTQAKNGLDAKTLFSQQPASQPFDAVITDIQMPEFSGLDLTRAIRKTHKGHLPIIALTANLNQKDIAHYLKNGVDQVLSKPVVRSDLEKALQLVPLSDKKTGKHSPARILSPSYSDVSASALDTENLYALKHSIGTEALKRILNQITENRRQQAARLTDLAPTRQWQDIADVSHQLVGSCGYQGLGVLADYFRQIQQAATQQNGAALHQLLSQLSLHLQLSDELIEDWVSLNLN